MTSFCFDSPDPEETARIAEELGRSIGAAGLVIGLIGPLGAGKTVFVKGLAEGLGIDARLVSSPTFVIAQQYPIAREALDPSGPQVLHHVDLYRLESEDELESMGFFDLFDPGAVLAVEWADRFPGALGPERLEIELDGAASRIDGVPGRTIAVRAYGRLPELISTDWRARIERRRRLGGAGAVGSGTETAVARPVGQGSGAEGQGRGPSRGLRGICLGLFSFWMMVWMAIRWIPGQEDPARGFERSESCGHPISIESDLWGTRRVRCHASELAQRGTDEFPSGIGGILFGRALDLETVSALQLEALPRLGPARARAIVQARERHGFESVEALEAVHGIGPRTVARLSEWLTVGRRHRESSQEGEDRG